MVASPAAVSVPDMIAPLSESYAQARASFLEAASGAGARIDSSPHPLAGMDGEELAIDVAEVGPADNEAVVIVVSGTHGVEGYLGSALQRHHLDQLAEQPNSPDGPTMVFLHALNPYGFSWVRRVNEDNVDLNRNFIDWSQSPPGNDGYGPLADVLVPSSWSADEQERTLAALLGELEQAGMASFQQTISGGQYTYPTGIFYGGTEPVWSHRWVREFLGRRLAGVARAAVVDLHTGLGPWGFGELISSAEPESDTYARQCEWFGEVTCHKGGNSVSAPLEGDWLSAVPDMAPNTDVTAVAIEYGTVDTVSVLQSLRADAVLHAHGDPTASDALAIRNQVRAAFNDDDPTWLEKCQPRYASVVEAAVRGLANKNRARNG